MLGASKKRKHPDQGAGREAADNLKGLEDDSPDEGVRLLGPLASAGSDGRGDEAGRPGGGGGGAGASAGAGGAGTSGEGKAGEREAEEEDANASLSLGLGLDLAKLPNMSPQEMQDLLDKFTPEQMSRYEAYRRSALRQAVVKKMVSSVAGNNVGQNVIIVLAGIAKLFVGEMVETARIVMTERGDEGPIRPLHLREALRRLRMTNKMPARSRAPIFH